MTSSSKILTVSYGTFSCTLEGFDDSFDTMKAIAEYFRDLAGEDRYFGAEPPTPDAEMLAKIAEREISRRVEVSTQDDGIVLRPQIAAATSKLTLSADAETDDSDISFDDILAEAAIDTAEPDEDLLAESVAEDLAEAFDTPAPVEPAPVDANSVAAKLQRIRAVVSAKDAPQTNGFSEDEHADDMRGDIEDDLSTIDAAAIAAQVDAPVQDVAPVQDQQSDEDLDENLFTDTIRGVMDDAEPEAVSAPEADPSAVAEGQLEEIQEDSGSLSAEEEADLARELAEVEAELTGAQEDTSVQDALDDLEIDEDEYQEDLEDASLNDEISETLRKTARKTIKMGSDARAQLTTQIDVADEESSMSRLLDETNTQLDEPEGKGRRNAIAHLRQAVAATKADEAAGTRLKAPDTTEAYRDDLANVVRPRRPQVGVSTRSSRPAPNPAPAPLKLVAEQRVDVDKMPSAPVRPRRVGVGSPVAETAKSQDGFAHFAEEMGATELPDLLEAAAAYMSFVEGLDQFSRPQLMSKIRLVEHAESSREDRLRSFGQLLREGKIEKLSGGRFVASDRISFKPEARSA
ncbi:hypothetical protein GQR58_000012 [Nymphon striatum]|nr:hypothetical protein GQR58_000012 [Nymphon striatum]